MQKNIELFCKAAELIKQLTFVESTLYEEMKINAFKEVADKSEYVRNFMKVMFSIADAKRKEVQ